MNTLKPVGLYLLAILFPYSAWVAIGASRLLDSAPDPPASRTPLLPPLCDRPPDAGAPAILYASEREIREAARDWPTEDLPLRPWKQIESPRIAVRTDLPTAEMRRWAVILDEIVGALAQDDLICDAPRARIYRTRAQLDAHARDFGLEGAGGFYDSERREVVLAAEGLTLHTAAHELTHAILHARRSTLPPPWIAEGAAESAACRLLARWGLDAPLLPPDPDDVRRLTYEDWNRGSVDDRRARYPAARAWFEREPTGTVGERYDRLTDP